MKAKVINPKMTATLIAMAIILMTNLGVAMEISGRITQCGSGLEGITVELTGLMTATVTTSGGTIEESGYYDFNVTEDGTYTVTPISTDYEFDPSRTHVVVSGADVPNQNFIALYHHVNHCTVCHATGHQGGHVCDNEYGQYENLYLVACTICTPNSGDQIVKFTSRQGSNSYADGDEIYNGVCEVCHTQTAFHRNTDDGTQHFDGESCTSEICHPHGGGREFSAPYAQSHATHSTAAKGPGIGCTDCHSDPITFDPSPTLFADGLELGDTTVCDACHSPGGAFDGIDDPIAGAKTNWADGVYEADGVTLRSGKDKWCATCHDDEPALSRPTSAAIVLDNPEATFVGTWLTHSGSSQQYGDDVRYKAAGDGTSTATWRPNIVEAGDYDVYVWWTEWRTRATDAPYTIYYDGTGSPAEVRKDQTVDGGQWNYLGTWNFAAGTSGCVVLSDDANGQVLADAIKWEKSDAPLPGIYAPNVIGDNTTYGFYATGNIPGVNRQNLKKINKQIFLMLGLIFIFISIIIDGFVESELLSTISAMPGIVLIMIWFLKSTSSFLSCCPIIR